MRFQIAAATFLASSAVILGAHADTPTLNLSHERFVLGNGLTVIVHEDHSAPVVVVQVWYHVGSANEPAGRSGFAHLFEHLMFNGSENHDVEWLPDIRQFGGIGNGTTTYDRTNYFEIIPPSALARTLWMESDRMGHLVGAITPAALDEQRGVVQNEKRQSENLPYGRAADTLYAGLFPETHPYHHSTVGSMEDLDAASVDDVRNWFRHYYGPNNAVLVVAGDVTVENARSLVARYFADIPAGPDVDRVETSLPTRDHDTSEIQYDDVPAVMTDRAWVAPPFASRERALLSLAASVLGGGPNSRLHRELVRERQVATFASSYLDALELASVFHVSVTLKSDQNARVAHDAIDRIVTEFLQTGPTRDELHRAVMSVNALYARELEAVQTRSTLLAANEIRAHDAAFSQRYLEWINSATPREVLDAARRYLLSGYHQLDVVPRGHYTIAPTGVDRTLGPPPAEPGGTTSTFPTLQTSTLSNGAHLVVVPMPAAPNVQISIQFRAGSATDVSANGRPGLASFAMDMLDEGTPSRTAERIALDAERYGALINTSSDRETSSVWISTLKINLTESLDLWSDILLNANFPSDAIERVRNSRLSQLAEDQADPRMIAENILRSIVFGREHPYGIPANGLGTEESIRSIDRGDLDQFRETWLRPDNATIFVVGDTTLPEIAPLLEQHLRRWQSPNSAPSQTEVQRPTMQMTPRVIIVDRPGAQQSVILGGALSEDAGASEDPAAMAMNTIFGGDFGSRLNMNIREDKHWAYYAASSIDDTRGAPIFMINAPVQTDRTADSLREIIAEMNAINGRRPIQEAELSLVVNARRRQPPINFTTQQAMLNTMEHANASGRPLDFEVTLPQRYSELSIDEVQAAAREFIRPNSMTWVIVGDRQRIEASLAALNIAPIEIFAADGQVLRH